MKEKSKKAAKTKTRAKGKPKATRTNLRATISRGPEIVCECGGSMKRVILPKFDFTVWSGVPSELVDVPGYRCSLCARETIPGGVINTSLRALSLEMIRLPHRLSAESAKYLRRTLEITQQELSDRMGLARETVAQWECGEREISPQQDMILRAIVVNRFLGKEGELPHEFTAMHIEALDALASVRSEPPRKPEAVVIRQSEYPNAYAS